MIRANRHVTPRGTPRVPSRAYVYERAADMRSTPHPDGRAGSVRTHASEAARAATQQASDPLRYKGDRSNEYAGEGTPKSTPRDATNLLRASAAAARGGERTRRSERATRKRTSDVGKASENKTKGRRHLPSPTSRRRISPPSSGFRYERIRIRTRTATPRSGKEERASLFDSEGMRVRPRGG